MNKEILRSKLARHGVRATALLTVVMGIVNLISATMPALAERVQAFEPFVPLEVRHGSRLASAVLGFFLIILAYGLSRRKHISWLLALATLSFTLVTHLLKGLDFEEASLALLLIILLLVLRHFFHARSDPPSVRQGFMTLIMALLFTLVYGSLGFFLLDRHFKISYNLGQAVWQTLVLFTTFTDPTLVPVTGFGHYFIVSIYVIAAVTLAFALFMLVSPVLIRKPASENEREQARAIVERYGNSPLARTTLFDDKSYFFSPAGSMSAYTARYGAAIALGDPIGPAEQMGEAIAAYSQFCHDNDWRPAFMSIRPDHLALYQKAGFQSACIGNEGIVDLATFTLEGSRNKDVRNAVSKVQRGGYTTEVLQPPLTEGIMRELREVSDAWLADHQTGEMGFTVGKFDDDYIRTSPVIIAKNAGGQIVAFANLVSEYQRNELTLDLMRHYPKPEHGIMETLFARMFEWARGQGYGTFNLGLSALTGVGEKPDDPRLEQLLHTLSTHFERYYSFSGLHNFKEKFHPRWEPRYLAWQNSADLPAIGAAFYRAVYG